MPPTTNKSTRTKKTISKTPRMTSDVPIVTAQEYFPSRGSSPMSGTFMKIGVVVLVAAAVLGVLAVRNRSWFIAASVNGSPVFTQDLNSRLRDQFGSQLLEQLVGEKLIEQEAAKQNISVSSDEIAQKTAEIEKSLGGTMTLDESLKLQGMTRANFESQLRIQSLIEKLLSNEVSVSGQEVTDYMKTNAATLTATTEAQQRTEAEQTIKNNKTGSAFLEWFQKVKAAAKIEKYL